MTQELIKEASEWLDNAPTEITLNDIEITPYSSALKYVERLTEALKEQQHVMDSEELVKEVAEVIFDIWAKSEHSPKWMKETDNVPPYTYKNLESAIKEPDISYKAKDLYKLVQKEAQAAIKTIKDKIC